MLAIPVRRGLRICRALESFYVWYVVTWNIAQPQRHRHLQSVECPLWFEILSACVSLVSARDHGAGVRRQ
jgi:hypothetical protein